LSSILEIYVLKRHETNLLAERGNLTTARIANSLAYPLWNLNEKETERVVLDEISSTDIFQIRVFDDDGALYVGMVKGADGAIRDIKDAGATAAKPPAVYSFAQEIKFKNARIGHVAVDVSDMSLQQAIAKLKWGVAVKMLLLAV